MRGKKRKTNKSKKHKHRCNNPRRKRIIRSTALSKEKENIDKYISRGMRRTDPEWIQFPVEYYREMKVYRYTTLYMYSLGYPLYISAVIYYKACSARHVHRQKGTETTRYSL